MEWKVSKDAGRILRLPFAHHPAMAAKTQELAADPAMTFERAVDVLCADMQAKRINELDLEMCQPGNAYRLRFAATNGPSPEGDFQSNVSGHVHRILAEQKP